MSEGSAEALTRRSEFRKGNEQHHAHVSGNGRRPMIVEVLGPAGAGKTSLVRTLCSSDQGIRAGLRVPRITYVPSLVVATARFLPPWLRDHRRDRWFSWREMQAIARLQVWRRALQRRLPTDAVAIIFDHGPIYRLAFLREFGPEVARSESFELWWRASLGRWMSALDMIVWLDAPDPTLLQRLDERGHWYLSAGRPDGLKREYLGRYRKAFVEILERSEPVLRPDVRRFRSDRTSAAQIADEVLAVLGSGRRRS